MVAVNQASFAGRWYTAKELQVASLQLCEACRGANTLHLWVDGDIPTTLLPTEDALHAHREGGHSSRVPRLQARRVAWGLPSVDLWSSSIDTLAAVEELYFGFVFNGNLKARGWP